MPINVAVVCGERTDLGMIRNPAAVMLLTVEARWLVRSAGERERSAMSSRYWRVCVAAGWLDDGGQCIGDDVK